jgi:hypothetical protein
MRICCLQLISTRFFYFFFIIKKILSIQFVLFIFFFLHMYRRNYYVILCLCRFLSMAVGEFSHSSSILNVKWDNKIRFYFSFFILQLWPQVLTIVMLIDASTVDKREKEKSQNFSFYKKKK